MAGHFSQFARFRLNGQILRLLDPHARLTNPELRRRARMQCALFISFALVMGAAAVGAASTGDLFRAFAGGGVGLSIGGYLLTRLGFFHAAAWGALLYLMAMPFVVLISRGDYTALGLAESTMLITSSMFHAYLMLPLVWVGVTVGVMVVATLLIPLVIPVVPIAFIVPAVLVQAVFGTSILIAAILRYYEQQALSQQTSKLAESERRYRDLFNATSEGLIIHKNGTVLTVNPAFCELSGYQPDEIIGQSVARLYPPEAHADIMTLSQRKDPYQVEGIRKDGSRIPVEITGREHVYQGERVRVGTIRDISKQKEAEARRLELAIEREKNTMYRRLLGDLSHDLRTPLTGIKTSTYLIRKLKHDPDAIERHLVTLDAQTNHLQRIFDDLLHMARLDRDTTNYMFTWGDPTPIVRDAVTRHTPAAQAKQQLLTLLLPDRLPRMLLDAREIDHMIGHLLTNAITYTPPGGRISVRAEALPHPTPTDPGAEDLVIVVEDTGIGIRPVDLPFIFDRFYRADSARSTETGGAGLGLTIALKIAQAHRGTITVASEEGRGSSFRVQLPRPSIPASLSPHGEQPVSSRK